MTPTRRTGTLAGTDDYLEEIRGVLASTWATQQRQGNRLDELDRRLDALDARVAAVDGKLDEVLTLLRER